MNVGAKEYHFYCSSDCKGKFRKKIDEQAHKKENQPKKESEIPEIDSISQSTIDSDAILRTEAKDSTPKQLIIAFSSSLLGVISSAFIATSTLFAVLATALSLLTFLLSYRLFRHYAYLPTPFVFLPSLFFYLTYLWIVTAFQTPSVYSYLVLNLLSFCIFLRIYFTIYFQKPIDSFCSSFRSSLPRLARIRNINSETLLEIQVSSLKVGDEIILSSGELCPIDGVVESGEAWVELPLSLEKKKCQTGDEIIAGARVIEGTASLLVARSVGDRVFDLPYKIWKNGNSLQPFQMYWLIMLYLIPIVLIWFLNKETPWVEQAIMACTVGICIPLFSLFQGRHLLSIVGIYTSLRRGIKFPDVELFEQLGQVQHLSFSVPGTLSHGKLDISEIKTLSKETSSSPLVELLTLIKGETSNLKVKKDLKLNAKKSQENPHKGYRQIKIKSDWNIIATTFEGDKMVLGGRQLLLEEGFGLASAEQEANEAESRGFSVLFFAFRGRVRSLIIYKDKLKDQARATVQRILDLGINVMLFFSDHQKSAQKISDALGVSHYKAELSLEEKIKAVQNQNDSGIPSALIGHHEKDERILSEAELGISVQNPGLSHLGNIIAIEGSEPIHIAVALSISKLIQKKKKIHLGLIFLFVSSLSIALAFSLNHILVFSIIAFLLETYVASCADRLLKKINWMFPIKEREKYE